MRIVVQRVRGAKLSVDNKIVSEIGAGLCVYFGVKAGDEAAQADKLMKRVANLRIFEDENGKMNRSALDLGLEILMISQFTLYGDCKSGNRPSFIEAARPEIAEPIYRYAVEKLRESGLTVKCGIFGADMQICQHNDGPVTIILEG